MKTTVEPVEGNKVKIAVEVPEADLSPAIDAAFRQLAREVRLPGFRPGKVPRKVLEARFGIEHARAEALREALPGFYAAAIDENDVDPIDSPEIEVTGGEVDGDVTFDAVVEVRPEITASGYRDLTVEIPSPLVSDEDVDEQLDVMRSQVADTEPVERAVESGDLVTIDIEASQDGEPVPGLTADGYAYEVGLGLVVPEIDEQLVGSSVGDTLEFDAPVPGHDHDDDDDEDDEDHEHPPDLSFKITVQEVAQRVLPEVDDEFAAQVSEFETADELVAELKRQLQIRSVNAANNALLEGVGEQLAGLATDDVPESMVNAEIEHRVMDMAMRLRQQGSGIEEFLARTGTDPAQLTEQFREQADQSARLDLVLRSIASQESLTADEDDVDEEIMVMAAQLGRTPDDVRQDLEHGRRMGAVRSDILKRKALELVRDAVRIVDTDGAEVDRSDLELPDQVDMTAADGAEPDSSEESSGDDS